MSESLEAPPEHVLLSITIDDGEHVEGGYAHIAKMRKVVRSFSSMLRDEMQDEGYDFAILSEPVMGNEESLLDVALMEIEMRKSASESDFSRGTLMVVDASLLHRMAAMSDAEREATNESVRIILEDGPSLGVGLICGVSSVDTVEHNAAMLSISPASRAKFVKATIGDEADLPSAANLIAARMVLGDEFGEVDPEELPCSTCGNEVLYWKRAEEFIAELDEMFGESAVRILSQLIDESEDSDPMVWHCALCNSWGDKNNVAVPSPE